MVIVNHCLPADYQIIFSGDWHEGTVLQEPKVLHKVRDEILNVKNTHLIHPGDWCEAITIDDPRYSRLTDRGLDPIDQYKTVKNLYVFETTIYKRIAVIIVWAQHQA